MDLGAYVQMEDLDAIAKENGIDVPRLRGYRLMKDEEPVSKEELDKLLKEHEVYVCEYLCRSIPYWSGKADCHTYSWKSNRIKKHYLIKDETVNYEKYKDIRWDRIHGRKRKILKFEIKKQRQKVHRQFEMWNKYAGREDVLYIHARIGGNNWAYFGGNKLLAEPWFLDRVDDCFDSTYCDIYAKIKKQIYQRKV